MKAAATYCSRAKNPNGQRIAAIELWGSDRILKAQEAAEKLGRNFFLLTPDRGLIPPTKCVQRAERTRLTEDILEEAVGRVVRQLKKTDVTDLLFFANPFDRDRMDFIRLILLACERSDPKVTLELARHDGSEFSEWSVAMDAAGDAKRDAIDHPNRPTEAFFSDPLKRFPNDGMVWYRKGEAHKLRNEFGEARQAYAKARELFQMSEWKTLAQEEEDKLENQTRRTPTASGFSPADFESVSRLPVPDPSITKLCHQAMEILSLSPAGAVALSRSVLIRIIRSKDPSALNDTSPDYLKNAINSLRDAGKITDNTADAMHEVRSHRNEIEFVSGLPTAPQARTTVVRVIDILKRLYPRR